MRKTFAALVVALALLSACPHPDTPGAPRPLAGLGSGSASGYFIEGSSIAGRAAGDQVATSGTLKRVGADGSTGAVVFFDDTGAVAAVTTRKARALADGRLVLAITYGGADSCVVANTTTGTLTPISPEPEGWDYAREEAGAFWYAAQGAIWRLDLATLATARQTAPSEAIASGVWFKRCAAGLVATVPGSGTQVYFASPTAAGQSNYVSLPDPATYVSFETAAGVVYSVHRTGANVAIRPYAETGIPGTFAAGADEPLCVLPWTPSGAAVRFSSKKLTRELVIGWDGGASSPGGGILRIVADSGGIKYEVVSFTATDTFIGSLDSISRSEGENAYFGYPDPAVANRWRVWNIRAANLGAKAVSSGSSEILADQRISAIMPVGNKLYYVRDSGSGPETMVFSAPGPATLYASGVVSIEAVK